MSHETENPQIAAETAGLFERLTGGDQTPPEPQRRQCAAITRKGARCKAWAVTGLDQCAGHAQLYRLDPSVGVQARLKANEKAAEQRREARMSVRQRAAAALDEDWPDVLAALQAGIREGNASSRARAAVSYVQLVYGRQLQAPADEQPSQDGGPLDVDAMTNEELELLKRRLIAEHPDAARELGMVG